MKIGVVIVWFNPSSEHLDNLKSHIKQCECICVVDNSLNKYLLPLESNIHYIHNSNVGGIAGAFNRGADWLIKNNVDYFYTFDQDSVVPDDFYEEMTQFTLSNNASISCPNFYDVNSKTYGKFVKMSKFYFSDTDDNKTHFCISSGMCIKSSVFIDLNKFDERFVIDHVDTEFLLKAVDSNIDVFYNKNVLLNHQIGERDLYDFLGVNLKPNHHNHIRKYYISRNGTYLSFKYFKKYKGYFVLNFMRIIHELICTVLYEENKMVKIYSIFKGLKDAVKGKLGAYKE
ncbi:glycosyltransferase [Marinomonas sp.]|uniref:glycosyltransferase n=1 Tax=Marinomonas sp. TaxID=1904862 RepID=UPI003BAD2FC8